MFIPSSRGVGKPHVTRDLGKDLLEEKRGLYSKRKDQVREEFLVNL